MKKILLIALLHLSFILFAQKKWTLRETVEYAVQRNLQIVQNDYTRQQQAKNLEIAKREKLPTVSGTLGDTASFGQGQDVFGNIKRNDNFQNNANISANVLLFNHGRVEKTVRKTEYDVQASSYDVETVKNNITLQVTQQYLSVLLNKEILKINESGLGNAEKVYSRAKITTEVGTTAQTVLAEAAASLAREKQVVETSKIDVQRSKFALAQLLLLPDYTKFDVEDIPLEQLPVSNTDKYGDILEGANSTEPQIKAAEYRIKAAEQQTEVAKTAFWPTISATAGVGTFYFNSLVTNIVGYDASGNPIFEPGFLKQYKNNFGQQVGLNATVPIFNKGITKIQVEQAKINELSAKTALEQAKQDLRQAVQKAQFDRQANFESYLAAQEAEKSTRLAMDFSQKSFEAGRATIYELTASQNNYANAQGALAQAKYNYLFSEKVLDFYAGIPLGF